MVLIFSFVMKYKQQNSKRNKKSSSSNQNKSFRVQNIIFCQGQIKIPQSVRTGQNQHLFIPIVVKRSNVVDSPEPKSKVVVLVAPPPNQILALSSTKASAQDENQNEDRFELLTQEKIQKNYNFPQQSKPSTNDHTNLTSQELVTLPLEKTKQQEDLRFSDSIQVVQQIQQEQIIVEENVPSEVFKQENKPKQLFQGDSELLIKNDPPKPEFESSEDKVESDNSGDIKFSLQEVQKKQNSDSQSLNEVPEPKTINQVAQNQNNSQHKFSHVKSIRKPQPKVKIKQPISKGRSIAHSKSSSYVPEPLQYTCHCNTRGCRDHYCGCYRRNQKCSTSCLCSDCTNITNYKAQKRAPKVIKDERMELVGQVDVDLQVGIQFEPVCFMGFGNDQQELKVSPTGQVANELRVTQEEQRQQQVQQPGGVFLSSSRVVQMNN